MLRILKDSRLFSRFSCDSLSVRKDCLDRLPNDVLLDGVMSYLDIFDILRPRRASTNVMYRHPALIIGFLVQVSKLYYELTHHAAVWKRLLRHTDVPLPPLPPTARHTPSRMSGFEVERLLCRAYSQHINWSKHNPRCFSEWTFNSHHRVLEMALVPGGRYLVASVTDPMETTYSLVVFAIDVNRRCRPIAKMDTQPKRTASASSSRRSRAKRA
ncbi:hypothetical protein NUW54_g4259 [Trametes sanguinea]|uniref:Uncharacterized protein n=1 Tax=Trametes sanguinea TaxID=158606 RepID=A0ACC1PYF7_9APHY|nr:hypothetical protein NUW54_g4259 [Trametes sanguinea]